MSPEERTDRVPWRSTAGIITLSTYVYGGDVRSQVRFRCIAKKCSMQSDAQIFAIPGPCWAKNPNKWPRCPEIMSQNPEVPTQSDPFKHLAEPKPSARDFQSWGKGSSLENHTLNPETAADVAKLVGWRLVKPVPLSVVCTARSRLHKCRWTQLICDLLCVEVRWNKTMLHKLHQSWNWMHLRWD